ncbi:hypothetical protein N0V83_000984 [Neocucurbitaria cava]|uniref:Uncharacterized protein n=1 Tax=Neocucurbitaria cava TaxID=798079 RepID=A0A9W8YI62_9PLEO|nr:hypothetical protein N0V83_000984 [Neocucurbitaria cava]
MHTLRRKGNEVFAGSEHSSTNPFEADDFEFEFESDPEAPPSTDSTHRDDAPVSAPNLSPVVLSQQQISTLKRVSAEVLGSRPYASANPFEPDDDEFENSGLAMQRTVLRRGLKGWVPLASTPSLRLTRVAEVSSSTLPQDAVAGEDDVEGCAPVDSSLVVVVQSNTPTSTPRISTLRRAGADVLAKKGYFSPNPWDADDEEFEQEADGISVPPTSTPSLRLMHVSEVSSSTSPQKGAGDDNVAAPTSVDPSLLVIQPKTPNQSPRISTLRRAGEVFFANKGYSSSSPWDADDDEFGDEMNGMSLRPTKTIRGNPLKSQRGASRNTMRRLPMQMIMEKPGEESDKENVEDGFDRLRLSSKKASPSSELSPGSDFGSPMQSVHLSPLGAKVHLTSKSTSSTSLKLPGGQKQNEFVKRSIWDADDDEFDRWPGRKT